MLLLHISNMFLSCWRHLLIHSSYREEMQVCARFCQHFPSHVKSCRLFSLWKNSHVEKSMEFTLGRRWPSTCICSWYALISICAPPSLPPSYIFPWPWGRATQYRRTEHLSTIFFRHICEMFCRPLGWYCSGPAPQLDSQNFLLWCQQTVGPRRSRSNCRLPCYNILNFFIVHYNPYGL